jgi:putative ABC transport system permease protein
MKLFGLIWANLSRRRTRTVLTLLSLVAAFVLFVLLQAIAGSFDRGGFSMVGVDRLSTSPKYSLTDDLPYSQKMQILGVDGVEAVTGQHWFGGIYQDPKNFFAKFPVEPREYFAMYPENVIDPAVLEAFASQRTAMVAEASLAEKYGWQTGDIIPIQADIWPKADGSRNWEFELVGTFAIPDSPRSLMLFQYQYFTESVADYGKDTIGRWTVRLSDPERAEAVAIAIDQLFENSPNPTRTVTEDEASRQFANQLGDIGFIASMIMTAVFFTIVLLTGNTMTQSLRERVPELAVLKTLGFTDGSVSGIVLAEALLLCAMAGLIGVGLSFLVVQAVAPLLSGVVGNFEITMSAVTLALAGSIALGFIVGSVPALTARRLTIVDALRRS